MPLEKIIEKIEEEAREQAERILSEAKDREREIIASSQKKAETIKEGILKKAQEKEQKRKESILALAALEARKRVLEFKQSIVSQVYAQLLEDLVKLTTEDYQTWLENILLKNAAGDEEIITASSEKGKITKDFIQRINKKLTAAGKKGNLILSDKKRDFRGGVVLHRGKLEINYSFENLLKNSRDITESEVVKILFTDR